MVVSNWTEPFKHVDRERRGLDGDQGNQHPAARVERFYIKQEAFEIDIGISYLQFAVYYQPRNAVGDMMPVLLATTIAIPDSRNGAVKSTADSRSELIWNIDKIREKT